MLDALRIENDQFIDTLGRHVLLRGVNLSGSTKLPTSHPHQDQDDFSEHRHVSFVGRPFPLTEAPEHFARLRHWGFNCLRLLTTWEAVEHEAPGVYDTAYLDYFQTIVEMAGEYDFYVFIDPHQDVWSRMTGGDGAPGWTLEKIGFNIANFDNSEAAITFQARYPNYPIMMWPDNYNRLACATMFSLFFAGQWLAPDLDVDGVGVQDFLQGHFIGAMQQIAQRIKDMPHVLGYGTLNEPGKGYIGAETLSEATGFIQQHVRVNFGDGMLLGSGFPRTAAKLEADDLQVDKIGEITLNPAGISAWQSPEKDVWHNVGVWDYDVDGKPLIICDDYFEGIDFLRDGLTPFTQRYATGIREIHPDAMIFVESDPTEAADLNIDGVDNIVNAGHWYDTLMLMRKQYDGENAYDHHTDHLVHGVDAVTFLYKASIATLKQTSAENLNGAPTLVGEFGLAYDINQQQAYQDGDFSMHELALSRYYDALDANLVSSTQWNYTPDNSNFWGDNWNGEDLSIFSRDQQLNPYDLDSGGRAIRGFCRPYVQRAAGKLLKMHFDHHTRAFTATVEVLDPQHPTVIYLPANQYAAVLGALDVETSSGMWQIPPQTEALLWQHTDTGQQTITFTFRQGE